jgi:uncharacterized RDD family membrane protein YckC
MSTLHTAKLFPTWKQEVNRRVADHMNRKNATVDPADRQPETHFAPASRAALAAARVAARYANAPSYNQLLADEARNAMHAALAAQKAAEQAHAAAQMVLAGLEAVDRVGSKVLVAPARNSMQPADSMANRHPDTAAAHTEVASPSEFDNCRAQIVEVLQSKVSSDSFDWDQMTLPVHTDNADESATVVERSQPVHDNIIQFPREIVATRRLRPRRVEGPLAQHESTSQLSIFEIDPETISTQPSSPVAEEPAAPTWMRPEWPASATEPEAREELIDEPGLETSKSAIVDLAPLGRRVIAGLIDGSLDLAIFAGLIALASHGARLLHNARAFELCAVLLLILVSAGYQALFFSFCKATPGMWYAGIGLCTLDGYNPERKQRCRRLMALPLSVLPLGLGVAWSLFDEEHLAWHDRLSETYLRLR